MARRAPFCALAFLVGLLACDTLLEVELPTRVPASTLDNPALAPTMVQSAIADFECAFTNYVLATGGMAGEFYSSGATPPSVWSLRLVTPQGLWATLGCTKDALHNFGLYTPLSTARFQADDALKRVTAFPEDRVPAPGRTTLAALAAAYAGYSYTLFGEGFCHAAFDTSRALNPSEVLAIAEQRFTTAIELAQTAGNDSIRTMALVGRARVRLDLGKLPQAEADARLVPAKFVKNATYSNANQRRWNRVWEFNHRIRVASVSPSFRNLRVGGVLDSRVVVTDANRKGDDGLTPLWLETKYTSESSPIAIASWDEAQLIIAEAKGGQEAVSRINALRAQTNPTLPPYASSDSTAITQQVREERRRELFLEGHRLNDLLRWGLPLPRDDHRGRPHGAATCIPLPDVERCSNPNIGCTTP